MTKKILPGPHFIINKYLIKKIGLNPTILLMNLIEKAEYIKDGEWFNCTTEDIKEDTSMSYYLQKKSLKILKNKKFICTKIKGAPPTQLFKINKEQIISFLNLQNLPKQNLQKKTFFNLENLEEEFKKAKNKKN